MAKPRGLANVSKKRRVEIARLGGRCHRHESPLARFRYKLELTLREVADALKVSPEYVRLVEAGARPLPKGWADRLAELYQVHPDSVRRAYRQAA